jgi:hypothetical protein
MTAKRKPPKPAPRPPGTLQANLGAARDLWDGLLQELAAELELTKIEWKGEAVRVKRKARTILYLLPGEGAFRAAFVLGDRAIEATRQAGLPAGIERLIAEAKRYTEGTGFRMDVTGPADVAAVLKLARIKLAN